MADLKNDDLLLVNRDETTYTAPGEAIYGSYLTKPEIATVELVESNPGVLPRFTDQEFVATVTMAEEGQPLSEKKFDAFVEGAILRQTETSEITNISDDILNEPWALQALSGESTYNAIDVCWWQDKNLYLMVGNPAGGTTPTYKYSSDGLNFSTAGNITVASTVGVGWGCIVAGTTTAVATGQANNQVKLRYSTTGTSWTDVNATAGNKLVAGDPNAPTNVKGIATDGINFVAVGLTISYSAQTAYNEVWTSTNGIDWTNPIDPLSIGNVYNNRGTSYYHTAYGNGVWVIGGKDGKNTSNPTDNRKFIYSTNNGNSWSFATSPFDGNKDPGCTGVCYSQSLNRFVATFDKGNQILWSDDGITWNASEFTSITNEDGTPAYFNTQAVTYGNGKFIAVSLSSSYKDLNNASIQLPKVYQSTDGKNWEAVPGLDTEANWKKVTCGNPDSKRFVAVRSANLNNIRSIMYSDGGGGAYTHKDLTFQNDQDFEFIDVGSIIKSSGGATGEVLEITSGSNFMKINPVAGNLLVGETVLGPVIIANNAKKYLKFNDNGDVETLLDTPQSPPYLTTDVDPTLTFKFPSTFPSGFTPDEELGEGTTLTVEVTATNVLGSDGPKSDTVQPEEINDFTDAIEEINQVEETIQWSYYTGNAVIISEDGLSLDKKDNDSSAARATGLVRTTGKYYYEIRVQTAVPVSRDRFDVGWGDITSNNAYWLCDNKRFWGTANGRSFVKTTHNLPNNGTDYVHMCAIDYDRRMIWYGIDGAWYNNETPGGTNTYLKWDKSWSDVNSLGMRITHSMGAPGCQTEINPNPLYAPAGFSIVADYNQLVFETAKNFDKFPKESSIYQLDKNANGVCKTPDVANRSIVLSNSEGTWQVGQQCSPEVVIRSLTAEELEAQKLKFLTYDNRKEVVCGEEATAARAALQATLIEAGYDAADIAQAYSNLDN